MTCGLTGHGCVGPPQACCGRCEKHCDCRVGDKPPSQRMRKTRPTSDGRPREDERRS